MSFYTRSLVALLLLGACLVAQVGFLWHITAAGTLQDVELKRSLAESIPMEIGDWVGRDQPISDLANYGDDHLKRHYVHRPTGQVLELWMAYSRLGEDRGHHPEICLQVAGRMEDPRGRATIPVEGQPIPIQQYLYGRGGNQQWIYYWHYTLKSPRAQDTSELQRIYQRTQRRESSLTMEVFAPDMAPEARQKAVEFVTLVDQLMQNELPQPAVRGSQRSPVKRIDEH